MEPAQEGGHDKNNLSHKLYQVPHYFFQNNTTIGFDRVFYDILQCLKGRYIRMTFPVSKKKKNKKKKKKKLAK